MDATQSTDPRVSTPIDVALVGYGLAGAVFHAPFISATAGLRLRAIVTAGHRAQARQDHPGVEVVPSAEALWSLADSIGLVVVASPNRTHLPVALNALERGVPVVVDKPLAVRASDAQRLADEADRRGVLLSVFHNRRWDGDYLTVRKLVNEGTLGTVWRFESRFERWRPKPKAGWRELGDPAEGGGVLLDLGPHLIDQSLQLFGPVSRVYAEIDRRRDGALVPDDAFVALEHASGVRAQLWMSETAGRMGPRFRILGSRGAYVKRGLDPQEEMLRTGCRPHDGGFGEETAAGWGTFASGRDSRPVPTEPGNYLRYYELLAAALRCGGPAPVPASDGVQALKIIEAAMASAESKQVLSLD